VSKCNVALGQYCSTPTCVCIMKYLCYSRMATCIERKKCSALCYYLLELAGSSEILVILTILWGGHLCHYRSVNGCAINVMVAFHKIRTVHKQPKSLYVCSS